MKQLKSSIVTAMVLTIAIVIQCIAQAPPGGEGGTTYTLSGTFTVNDTTATQIGQTYTSSTTDQSGVYVLNSGNLTLTNCIVKTNGNSSSNDNSSFYGLNAGVLATSSSQIALTGCTITTTGSGANGVFAYGTASISSTGDKYTMTGDGGHAIMCSGGGTITVKNDTAVTSGGSSSNIATDRGGGTIMVNGGWYTSNGSNSAAVYSTGMITCTNATLIANGAEALVIEGSNKIVLNNCAVKCTYNKWGSLLYQSMSGDATGVDGYLTMTGGSFTYTGKAGGLFYNTNSTANYTLSGVTLNNSCDTLIRCIKGSWGGSSASSGGITNFIAKNQTLFGLIHVDVNSRAHITLQNSSSFTGAMNNANTADTITLTVDASSTWIVTKPSHLTSITNSAGISGTTVSNITGNGNNVYYKPSASANSYLGGKTYTLVNGGYLLPDSAGTTVTGGGGTTPPDSGGTAPPGGGGTAPPGGGGDGSSSGASTTYAFETAINGKWQYNSSANVYYIVGLYYCSSPADTTYEQMGIFVPGAYMNAIANSDGTYTCTVNSTATVNGCTASKAPIVVPVNTPGYATQSAPSGYSSDVAIFTSAGFIYLWPGLRGRTHGAPLGVTDLKAAVRYFRYLQAKQNAVPGNTNRIFSFGMSGGGAQSAIFGASGNSSLYNDYLTTIGAESGYKDNICGSMCWCPITNLDQGDAAHEWNMGLTRSSLSTADASISKGLAAEFATYVNAIGFKDPSTGNTLTLLSTSNGYYQNGSYYKYVMGVINDAVSRYNSYNSASVSSYSTTDTSALYSFVSKYKKASKGLGAYDDYAAKGNPENTVFGISGIAGHFDQYLAALVNTYASSYYSYFMSDLASTNVDAVGKTVQKRLMMYTPLYYLIDNSTYYSGGGRGGSDVAPYWRIRTGIDQSDAPLNTEMDIALALQNYSGVKSVDFETIWGQGHTQAEDSGNANTNFIAWVKKCVAAATTGVQQVSAAVPSSFQLSQNYPNPFNPTTTISFELPKESFVNLEVFNMLGEHIATLVRERRSAGRYSVTFNATSLSSGVYFCKMTADNFTAIKKVVLMK